MERYVGTKIVDAEPMTDHAFSMGVRSLPDVHPGVREGYKVVYEDGYVSWSPAAPFERAYRRLVDLAPERVVEIARVVHEANRGWCEAHGDQSQVSWDLAPAWQRESCINGVQFVLANPGAGDAAQHDNWSRVKLADGWTYGPVKNADAKRHPCLVPFDQLPPEQQAKDRLFRAIVLALASA